MILTPSITLIYSLFLLDTHIQTSDAFVHEPPAAFVLVTRAPKSSALALLPSSRNVMVRNYRSDALLETETLPSSISSDDLSPPVEDQDFTTTKSTATTASQVNDDSSLLAVDFPFFEKVTEDTQSRIRERRKFLRVAMNDPSLVHFTPVEQVHPMIPAHDVMMDRTSTTSIAPPPEGAANTPQQPLSDVSLTGSYPFSLMMHGSAPYIAMHAGQTAVFHIPGELIESSSSTDAKINNDYLSDQLFSDIALAWLLGMKIVLVAGCRFDADTCDLDFFEHTHECHNALQVTDAAALRRVEEEAGYLRTEVERKLNKFLRLHANHGGCAKQEGNVVSGHFYTAQPFGTIRGEDFQYTGFTSGVHVDGINQVLNNNDVVLLTTVGMSPLGELVTVNGYHLAASVAASLEAYKLIYMANQGCTMEKAVDDLDSPRIPIQELPLSFAQAITEHHQVKVHNTGFATFETARQSLDPAAVELLLHLGWAAWGLEHGVHRAHIVNPSDGALLEELFTSKNGANTCLYHDEEDGLMEDDGHEDSNTLLDSDDWDAYFSTASKQTQEQEKNQGSISAFF
jgi:amino-acid N-acetyltransferase